MNYKNYKYYIVVDEKNKPMAFDKDQFYYCESELNRSPFALKYYTKKQARKLIRQSNDWRIGNGFDAVGFKLMPIGNKIPTTKENKEI